MDDIIISPSKNLNFLNQYFQSSVDETGAGNNDQLQNNSNDSDYGYNESYDKNNEKVHEKKKKKN